MPLTEKGKKLKAKFRGQYGKKKGDSIFYAMENSGKLKKVLKARVGGGADASRKDFTPSTTAKQPPSMGFGNPPPSGGSVVGSNGKKKSKLPFTKDQVVSAALNVINFPLGYIYGAFKNKKPKIEKDYGPFTKTKTKTPFPRGGDEPSSKQLCPDGSMPPCKTSATQANKPNFLDNFQSYNSGGVSSGPPPKRGPNPQVPPIKMRNGKMTKTYKMSCPHRPDGIRGMGAAIKGHKFIGVK